MTSQPAPLPFLKEPHPRLLLFGGKGGVGKTSVAAATALSLARSFPQQKVLVVSTDPAHSLADSFEWPLGAAPRTIYGCSNLFGLEIDAKASLDEFLSKHGDVLQKIIVGGTYLTEEDLSQFLELQFPGLDEVMALLLIGEVLSNGAYHTVVVDTAPTGHTLRLLQLPAVVETWVKFLDTLLQKHRYLSRLYTGRYRAERTDAFIHEMLHAIQRVRRMLQDRQQSLFVPVIIPEAMVLAETQDLIARLSAAKIPLRHLLVNRVISPSAGCPFCAVKRQAQQNHLQQLPVMFPALSFTSVPYFPREVKGKSALTALAASMQEGLDLECHGTLIDGESGVSQPVSAPAASACRSSSSPEPRAAPVTIAKPGAGIKLFLLGGKGGVGKTSLACAFALHLSVLYPDKRGLLLSTDPAHSLADCLEQEVGARETLLKGKSQLWAREINPEELFERFKQTYAEEMADLFTGLNGLSQLDVPFDRDAMTHLLDLTPPGLDEIMALLEIATSLRADAFDLYVLDNAPTGHLLRFLDLPDLMQEWLRLFFALILKYRGVARLPKTSAMLVQMSKDLKTIRTHLSDPQRCEFIPVAIPTVMALNETRRLLSRLDRLNIPCRRLLLNQALLSSGHCGFCSTLRAEQGNVIAAFQQEFAQLEIVTLPWLSRELKGMKTLAELFRFTEP